MSTGVDPSDHLRQAARALLVDPDGRVLLVRFEFSDVGTVWAMPGGGVDPGESHLQALHRELAEEVGLSDVTLGPLIWEVTRMIPAMGPRYAGQIDRIHLVRCPTFEPQPSMTWEQLRAENLHELRWWSPTQIADAAASGVLFAPRQFPEMFAQLSVELLALLAAASGEADAGVDEVATRWSPVIVLEAVD